MSQAGGVGPNQIVWLFGLSGSGKRTFIDSAVAKEPRFIVLEGYLELPKNVLKCEAALVIDGRSDEAIISEVRRLISKSWDTSILLKVQWVDLEHHLPKRLREELPGYRHRIIMLYTDMHEIVQRTNNDPRPNRRVPDIQTAMQHYLKMLAYCLAHSENGFDVSWVDTSAQIWRRM